MTRPIRSASADHRKPKDPRETVSLAGPGVAPDAATRGRRNSSWVGSSRTRATPPLRQVLCLADVHYLVVRSQHVHPDSMRRIWDDETTERSAIVRIHSCRVGLGISSLRHEFRHRAFWVPIGIERSHVHESPRIKLAAEHSLPNTSVRNDRSAEAPLLYTKRGAPRVTRTYCPICVLVAKPPRSPQGIHIYGYASLSRRRKRPFRRTVPQAEPAADGSAACSDGACPCPQGMVGGAPGEGGLDLSPALL
jgi:hypothetical protein